MSLQWQQRLSSRSFVGFSSNDICPSRSPQTVIEKVAQKYGYGFPERKAAKAGDYVMIRPEHVMTHDNTGPVITKYALLLLISPISS